MLPRELTSGVPFGQLNRVTICVYLRKAVETVWSVLTMYLADRTVMSDSEEGQVKQRCSTRSQGKTVRKDQKASRKMSRANVCYLRNHERGYGKPRPSGVMGSLGRRTSHCTSTYREQRIDRRVGQYAGVLESLAWIPSYRLLRLPEFLRAGLRKPSSGKLGTGD